MAKSQEDFFRELLSDFKIEAAEHQEAIVKGMLDLEKQPSQVEYRLIVETTFRELHSLKGAARAVNQNEIEKLCQSMEGVFHQLKDGKASLTPPLFELLFQGVDVLNGMLSINYPEQKTNFGGNLAQLLKAIDNQLHASAIAQPPFVVVPPVTIQVEPVAPVETETLQASPIATLNEPVTVEQHLPKETVRVSTSKLKLQLHKTLKKSSKTCSIKIIV